MSVELLRQWAIAQALPRWGDAGFDRRSGQFVERIAFDGTPMLDAPRRVMVQARQIVAFASAYERGWFADGARLAESAYRQLLARYDGASQGWAFSADRDGRILDPTRDLYAQAFVLLALAAISKLGGGDEPLKLARATLAFMDAKMAMPAGGYCEALPVPNAPRRQNPHMHLFEALLAWHALVPNGGFDVRACAILDLLETHFVLRANDDCALVEYFDHALAPQGRTDFAFEPGHHFEWVWLIGECERLTGRGSPAIANALWTSALSYGFREDGAIFDEVRMSGRVQNAGVRLWPLTEAMKASCVGLPPRDDGSHRNADAFADTLIRTFLQPALPGLWHDHFDDEGLLISKSVPASTFYHVCGAIEKASD